MERLTVFDKREGVTRSSVVVGTLQIVKPLAPAQVEPTEELAWTEKEIAPGIHLLGYDAPTRVIGSGELLEIALYWEALRDVQKDYTFVLQLRDDEGQLWAEEESRPAYGSYPTTEWERGETIRDWHDLPIEAETADGDYHLYVGVKAESELLREVELGTIHVSQRERAYEVPQMEHQLGWRLGEGIKLLGYDVDERVKAGQTLTLTLYWQCVSQMDESYTVFTHLLDENNAIRGQSDSLPAAGEAPTTTWIEGEVITDPHEIVAHTQGHTGRHVIEVGMYELQSGQRLPVYDAQQNLVGDRILLHEIAVRPRS